MTRSKMIKDLGNLPPGMYGLGDGLQFRVDDGKTGLNRNFVLRYTLNGKACVMGLGKWPDVSYADARQKGDEYLRLAKQGIDPKAHRDAQAATVKAKEVAAKAQVLKTITFEEMAEQWIAARRDEWKSGKRRPTDGRYRILLSTYAYPTLGDNQALNLENGKNAYGQGSWASSLRYHDGTRELGNVRLTGFPVLDLVWRVPGSVAADYQALLRHNVPPRRSSGAARG